MRLRGSGARGFLATGSGFTLAETMLVLVVGAIMLGSATLVYAQLRDNAASALALQKVSALQGLIEEYRSQYPGQLPSFDALGAQWTTARPSDYGTSPWGGLATCVTSTGSCTTSSGTAPGIREISIASTTERTNGDTQVVGDNGILVYLHLSPSLTLGSDNDTALGTWDNSVKLWVLNAEYAVAAEDQAGRQFSFVRGPAFIDPAVCGGNGQVMPPQSSMPSLGNLCGGFGSPAYGQ